MPKRDDVEDIPMLKPDSDEIQAFRGGANQSKTDTQQATSSTVQREASIHPTPATAKAASDDNGSPKRQYGKWFAWLLVVMVAVSSIWWMHNRIVDMEDMLTVSRGELGHARKRIGELEALVVATDVSANKSGTVVQAQVKLLDDRAKERNKFVDSEIDKLWGVAYRTNKPAILENQKALENNSVGIKQHTEQLAAQINLIEQQQELIVGQQTSVANVVAENKQLLTDLSQQAKELTQAQTALQTLETSLGKSLAAVKNLQTDSGDLKTNVDEIQQSLIEIRATSEVLQDSLSTTLAKVNLTSEVALQNGELSQQNSESVAALRAQLTRQEEQVLGQAIADMAQMNLVVDEIQSELSMLQRQIRVVGAMEQTTAQLDERVYLAEQSMDSIITFRQETNRKLDQLATQIRNLQY